jgi:tRNA G18 (ribose-2'-O)-methylase SpoU
VIRIDSLGDPRVDDYRATAHPDLLRQRGLFIAEGRLVVKRLLSRPRFRIRSILLTDAALEGLRADLDARIRTVLLEDTVEAGLEPAAQPPVYVVAQQVMNGVAGFNIHRGCLASVERPDALAFESFATTALRRVIALEGVSNPDNIGGIFRNAAAFEVDLVVLGPGCGDPLYRKAVRTSMAASLMVPFVLAARWPEALHRLKGAGLRVLALTPGGSVRLADMAAVPRVALLLGAEGGGLSADALAAADDRVRIDTSDRVDSLNVATAAAIALHHFHRRGS